MIRFSLALSVLVAVLGASAQAEPENPATGHELRGPIRVLAWSAPPDNTPNIRRMIPLDEHTSPRKLAKLAREKPEGFAGLKIRYWDAQIFAYAQDRVRTAAGERTDARGVWYDHGIQTVRKRMDDYFWAYKHAGGRLDLLVLDYEGGRRNWQLGNDRRNVVEKIMNDPRAEEFRDELAEHGLTPDRYNEVWDWRSASIGYTLDQNLGRLLSQRTPGYVIWNALTQQRVNQALNQAIAEVALQYFPQAKISNYGSAECRREYIVPDRNGHLQFELGYVGTHNARSFYGNLGHFRELKLYPDGPTYGQKPFDVLRYHVNMMRAIVRSSDAPVLPWISHQNFRESLLRDNHYYQELIYHLMLCGADALLYWNPNPWHDGQDPDHFRSNEQDHLVDKLVGELNARFGDRPRRPRTLAPLAWDSELIVSGMRIGDEKTLYRVTLPPDVSRVAVRGAGDGADVVSGQGKIIDAQDAPGFWYQARPDEHPEFEAARDVAEP